MNLESLRSRAALLHLLRGFFRDRGFLEVETPLVSTAAIPERHIDLYQVTDLKRDSPPPTDAGPDDPTPSAKATAYLQASPEMHHKRLLCEGAGPIFEATRSFRAGEHGDQHSPEFTIVEWYRPGDDLTAAMDLVDDLMQELLGAPPAKRTTYREAFIEAVGVDPHAATTDELRSLAEDSLFSPPELLELDDRDEWLNLLLATDVEKTLGQEAPEMLYHYPASQSALAATTTDELGAVVAERFELYWRGLELANGYHELTDPEELRRRLERANEQREADGKSRLPLPERLLAAMTDPGLPPCAGVALGFDRLVMLATDAQRISDVRVVDGEP
ncbi:Elongation factor P--(R)-beta-lysine ligase [Pseudobythopirellula maris]|uniref:Elongation factor P--(R)-beta-lysine ligase n=1 Tax=Pseudobythopirellula maris TaxID=2527991 RepID=A0A5C5ZV38_9BACT|nr:EF-P lysine aminoacylase EpmA [Pseudobythopirellula maris]TWT90908.1 Elongation factor P--(R)-beta-lysine ligase [Pseudobythopirellula maris]